MFRKALKRHPVLGPILYQPFSKFAYQIRDRRKWKKRIKDVLACPDNSKLERHPDAGKEIDGVFIMHNGIRILPHSYYGAEVRVQQMLEATGGVHEPQEELVYGSVLKHVPPSSTMIELGSNWGFYSLWFAHEVPDARNFLIEPDARYLENGRKNFALNKRPATFHQAYVGKTSGVAEDGVATVNVDDYCKTNGIEHVHLLHADIQGAEVDMLHGARRMIDKGSVDWIFVSTHDNAKHRECLHILKQLGYVILAEADLDATYSFDGIIAAKRPGLPGPDTVVISKKPV